MDLDRAAGQAGEDARGPPGNGEREGEVHALVRRGPGEEALAERALPDDQAEPLLRDEQIRFLDLGGRGLVVVIGDKRFVAGLDARARRAGWNTGGHAMF